MRTPEINTDDTLQNIQPTERAAGAYQAQFDSIRALVCADLQQVGASYTMTVRQLIKTCIGANLEIYNLSELHSKNISMAFRSTNAKLVNHTTSNAMYEIDGKMLLVTFDLAKSAQSVSSAKHMAPTTFNSNIDVLSELLLLKQLQVLMATPIDDTHIVVPYNQLINGISEAKREMQESQARLHGTILSRAFTAFDFKVGLSLYTLNYSDDLSMLFWDRYTIVDVTMKSYYIEQHCIIEHILTNKVEPERFIFLHKPSKNSMAVFLADKSACLLNLVRPEATVGLQTSTKLPSIGININDEDDEDEFFTDEELIAMGVNPNERI